MLNLFNVNVLSVSESKDNVKSSCWIVWQTLDVSGGFICLQSCIYGPSGLPDSNQESRTRTNKRLQARGPSLGPPYQESRTRKSFQILDQNGAKFGKSRTKSVRAVRVFLAIIFGLNWLLYGSASVDQINSFGELSCRWWWLINENESSTRMTHICENSKRRNLYKIFILEKWTDMIIAMIWDILSKKCQ